MWFRSRLERNLEKTAFLLLEDQQSWRMRAEERIELSSALWSVRSREIHVKPLIEVESSRLQTALRGLPQRKCAEGGGEGVTLILPITDLPKFPLLDFQIVVAGQSVPRILRDRNDQIQARYVRYLSRRASVSFANGRRRREVLLNLLAEIFGFPASIQEHLLDSFATVEEYVQENLPARAQSAIYSNWNTISDKIADLAIDYTFPVRENAAQHPLLALPALIKNHATSYTEAHFALEDLRDLLFAARDKIASNDPKADSAEKLMSTYFGYGLRWVAMARCTVPLDRPFTISVSDKRTIFWDVPRMHDSPLIKKVQKVRDWLLPTARHVIAFSDAESNHVHISVPNSGVELVTKKCSARDVRYGRLGRNPQKEYPTREHYTRYDSKSSDVRLWIECRLRLSMSRLIMMWGVTSATLSAWVLVMFFAAWNYQAEARLNGSDVAAILLPVTLAGSLLLTRESSTLAMRVKRLAQGLLMLALAILWITTVCFYLMGRITIDTLHQN